MLTGIGGMGLRIDVEAQRIARLTIGGAGLVFGAVRHQNGDLVVLGMNVFFHRFNSSLGSRGL